MSKPTRTAVVLCTCSGNITDAINWTEVQARLAGHPGAPIFRVDELSCAVDHLEQLALWLRQEQPERLVVAACSPREHETTFRKLMQEAGLNQYFMQLVNVREQVAWVTADPVQATDKATRLLTAALDRVQQHQALNERRVPVRSDVAIIGAGPAGMQAALTLASAGRQVTLIEKQPFMGGLPVRFEDLFPNLDCGPCLLEPVMGDLLHGPYSANVQLLTLAEVTAIKGSFGNWSLTVMQAPRFIQADLCIACMECVTACPSRRPHLWNGSGELAAVDVPFAGALPNLPHIALEACRKLQGQECNACVLVCPVERALDFTDAPRLLDIDVGAIIVATGAEEKQSLPTLFVGQGNVHTAYAFERLLAMNGPSAGALHNSDGSAPHSLAIVHCAGSLDSDDTAYCSGTCCRDALKFAHLAAAKVDDLVVTRLVREQVVPGIGAHHQFHQDHSQVVRYDGLDNLRIEGSGASRQIICNDSGQCIDAEIIVLMRPLIPGAGTQAVCEVLELGCDEAGFIAPLHALSGSCATTHKGIYLAGSCRGPDAIREAFTSGTAAAALALSELVPGRDLVVDPQVAVIDAAHCAGCKTCLPLCPYQAISWQDTARVAQIEDIRCRGCGTCVAACPSGAILGCGFSRDMLRAELEGVLS
jgi:heterodisulfide reductase subunit A